MLITIMNNKKNHVMQHSKYAFENEVLTLTFIDRSIIIIYCLKSHTNCSFNIRNKAVNVYIANSFFCERNAIKNATEC
jgi:hypothetical protein